MEVRGHGEPGIKKPEACLKEKRYSFQRIYGILENDTAGRKFSEALKS
jgi:hypothetical protein